MAAHICADCDRHGGEELKVSLCFYGIRICGKCVCSREGRERLVIGVVVMVGPRVSIVGDHRSIMLGGRSMS